MWENTINFGKKNIKKFDVFNKQDSFFHKFIGKIMFWNSFYMNSFWTTIYPKVWKPIDAKNNWKTLQHELVHLLDAQTFFGLMPLSLKWINVFLFSILYLSPQIFVLFALGSFYNLWFLLFLVFLLPLPSPGRAFVEIRAYRRTLELEKNNIATSENHIIEQFTGPNYYFMFPFKKTLKNLLAKESPYKDEMDKIL